VAIAAWFLQAIVAEAAVEPSPWKQSCQWAQTAVVVVASSICSKSLSKNITFDMKKKIRTFS
jgi:hypothetical protein